jgi:hypothetical protein
MTQNLLDLANPNRDPYKIQSAHYRKHHLCQTQVSSVCSVCQHLSIRKEGQKLHSHCNSGVFGESGHFNWLDGGT